MNTKSLIKTILAVFAVLFITNGLIHGLWMMPRYLETAHLWRPEAEMAAYRPWLFVGDLVQAVAFSVLWAVGFAEKAKLTCSLKYGTTMGLFFQANTFMTFAVTPIPGDIAVKWFIAGVAQIALLGVVAFFVYKPNKAA